MSVLCVKQNWISCLYHLGPVDGVDEAPIPLLNYMQLADNTQRLEGSRDVVNHLPIKRSGDPDWPLKIQSC